jgi:hypothetical protein
MVNPRPCRPNPNSVLELPDLACATAEMRRFVNLRDLFAFFCPFHVLFAIGLVSEKPLAQRQSTRSTP